MASPTHTLTSTLPELPLSRRRAFACMSLFRSVRVPITVAVVIGCSPAPTDQTDTGDPDPRDVPPAEVAVRSLDVIDADAFLQVPSEYHPSEPGWEVHDFGGAPIGGSFRGAPAVVVPGTIGPAWPTCDKCEASIPSWRTWWSFDIDGDRNATPSARWPTDAIAALGASGAASAPGSEDGQDLLVFTGRPVEDLTVLDSSTASGPAQVHAVRFDGSIFTQPDVGVFDGVISVPGGAAVIPWFQAAPRDGCIGRLDVQGTSGEPAVVPLDWCAPGGWSALTSGWWVSAEAGRPVVSNDGTRWSAVWADDSHEVPLWVSGTPGAMVTGGEGLGVAVASPEMLPIILEARWVLPATRFVSPVGALDFDGDDHQDVLVNGDDGKVWVVFGPFDREDAEALALRVDAGRFGTVLGDLDRDGFDDVGVHGSGIEGVALFFGRPRLHRATSQRGRHHNHGHWIR